MEAGNGRVLKYRSCGLTMGLSNSVVKTCHEFVQELCRLQGDFIKFPTTRADLQKKIHGFSMKSNIPNVVAAIDGSHIAIKAPNINHEDYFNRKHFYSFVVQRVVDSDVCRTHSISRTVKLSNATVWLVYLPGGSENPSSLAQEMSWALLLFFLMYPWRFPSGSLAREIAVRHLEKSFPWEKGLNLWEN